MHTKQVIIGIDGGGTHTRVMVSNLEGEILACIERGAASIYKDIQAVHNVQSAIAEALSRAGCSGSQVLGLAAGIAGYDQPSDLEWIEPLTALPELHCQKWHVNDAVSAHSGALLGKPGIIVIAGTGSNIIAITENGQYVRNSDFHHYAFSAARFLAYDAMYEMLAGNTDETDASLTQAMLEHWKAGSISELGSIAKQGFIEDRRERDKHFGDFAPVLTAVAELGSSAAQRVCDRAISQIKVGIELLAASFANEEVSAAFIGSVANSSYFYRSLNEQLTTEGRNKRYVIEKPALPPAAGSILLAMKNLDLSIHENVIQNLKNGVF